MVKHPGSVYLNLIFSCLYFFVHSEEEKKRKSKWDNPAPMPQPVPLMQRPLISLVSTTIIPPTVVSSATGAKTTVISSIGTIKKPKVEK